MSRIVDYVIYVAVGLAVVAGTLWYATVDAKALSPSAFVWIQSVSTLLISLTTCWREFRNEKRSDSWIATVVIFLAHGAVTVFALRARDWRLLWWIPIVSAEVYGFVVVTGAIQRRRMLKGLSA